MNPAEKSSFVSESSAYPLARIDTQDEEFIIPLREYLETNGCRVVVNPREVFAVAYHIATGDAEFVKSIFSSYPDSMGLRLGIVQGFIPSDDINDLSKICKVVLIDPVLLHHPEVIEIFSFFFAGNFPVLDKRRNIHEPAPLTHESASDITGLPNMEHLPDVVEKTDPLPLQTFHKTDSVTKSTDEEMSVEDQKRIGTIISDVYSEEQKIIKRRKRKSKKNIWATVGLFIIILLFPFFWYGTGMLLTAASFGAVVQSLRNGNFQRARQFQGVGNYWLRQSAFALGLAGAPFRLIGMDTTVRGQERLISLFGDLSQTFNDTLVISETGKDVARNLLTSQSPTSTGSPVVAMNQLQLSVTSVISTLGLAQAELETLIRDKTFPFSVGVISGIANRAEGSVVSLRSSLTSVNQMLTLYPRIAGYREPKTYLVLLQNSNELRPTGGFIGSVGVMKFDTGSLSDFSIQDVYALDGQLKGHVDPPAPLKDLMGAEHWYLRDSNWDSDFSQSATRSAWFYQKEATTPVDGVIAVNVPFVIDLLKVTGPITLSDYKDQISADNFFGKSFYYTQHDFFPGSTQKSDFLGSLTRTLMTKITSDSSINPIEIFRAISAGLSRKDIQFMFTDPDVQQLVEHYRWGGRIFSYPACEGTDKNSCLFDPIVNSEANVSVSKVNYFIRRSVVREITVGSDGAITESYTMSIHNTADSLPKDKEQGLGGSYLTYVRFYTADDALVNDVTFDGSPISSRDPKRKGVPEVPYIETTTAPAGTRGIGVAFAIPAGTQHAVRISFRRNSKLVFGRGGAVLDIFNYKHPGISDEEIKTVVNYPEDWVRKDEISIGAQKQQGFLAKNGQVEYNNTILEDQLIRLRFLK